MTTVDAGQVIDGKYKIISLVGRGGMGSVYAGEHLRIGRRVAIKILHPSAAANSEVVTRFEREAQAAARIGNDHILEVLDFGSLPDGSRYMVCEFLDGETFATRVQRQRQMGPAELVPITRQLLNGLAAAHAAGVVHRDLKPDNIFLLNQKAGWADFVKIIDFGISKFQPLNSDDSGMRMTATGVVMGTPYYLSPEQARGTHDADQRSDIYAVGVILYEAVTGKLPFEAQNFNDLLFKIVLETPKPAHEIVPGLDVGFSSLIAKAMARNPSDRFQTTAEFMTAIEQWAMASGLSLTGPVVTSNASRQPLPAGVLGATPIPTPSTWGGTQRNEPTQPAKPKLALPLALAIGGFVFISGAAYGLYSLVKSPGPDASTAAASAPPSAAAAAEKPTPPPVREEPAPPKPVEPEATPQTPDAQALAPATVEAPKPAPAAAATNRPQTAGLAATPKPPGATTQRPAAAATPRPPGTAKPDAGRTGGSRLGY